jgi:hypothetical protein
VDPLEGESDGARALRERGLVHDRVSRRQLAGARVESGRLRVGAARYRALVLDPIEVAEAAVIERAIAAARAGIPVIALGALPDRAPGATEAETRDAAVREATARLAALATRVDGEPALAGALRAHGLEGPLGPVGDAPLRFSLAHRRSARGHVLLVFNESWAPARQRLRVNLPGAITRWDPRSGAIDPVRAPSTAGDVLELTLGPAESIVLTIEP